MAAFASVFSDRRIVSQSSLQGHLRRRSSVHRRLPLAEGIVMAVYGAGRGSVTSKANRATRIITHQKIAGLLVDILVVRVMAATALDVTVDQFNGGIFARSIRYQAS